LFPIFGSFEKIFSLKIKTEIQPNTFSSSFSISNENENKKQPNQTPPKFPLKPTRERSRIQTLSIFEPLGNPNP